MPRAEKTAKGYNRMEDGVFLRGRIWWVCYRAAGKTVYESSGSERRSDAVALRESKRTQGRAGTLVPDARKVTYEDLKEMSEADATAKGNRSRPAPFGGEEVRDGGLTLEISTDHPGAFAQTGTSRGEPQREIVTEAMLEEAGEKIADIIGDIILGDINI